MQSTVNSHRAKEINESMDNISLGRMQRENERCAGIIGNIHRICGNDLP